MTLPPTTSSSRALGVQPTQSFGGLLQAPSIAPPLRSRAGSVLRPPRGCGDVVRLDLVANMDDLPELTMENVLANVAALYGQQQPPLPNKGWSAIYTTVGPVLIAMNPFKNLPIYSDMWTNAFRSAGNSGQIQWASQSLGPHCYLTAEQAYQGLRMVSHQSVVICGESGAGKTVTNRMMIEYFLDAEALSSSKAGGHDHKERIAQANLLLESFGNAKTLRNDNSSRFGKYSQLSFDGQELRVSSFEIEHYLLERSRVCFEPGGERNYHIFHQLVNSRNAALYELGGGPSKFAYTRSGADVKRVDGTSFDDAKDFEDLIVCMQKVGFADDYLKSVFQTIAAVLHIGNLQFQGDSDHSSLTKESIGSLKIACELLGVDSNALGLALVIHKTERFTKQLGVKDADAQRDALAKMLYARVFDDLVANINNRLMQRRIEARIGGACIGLLDIFGFEDMPINGFEQMYINLTNERIQLLFNTVMFERELDVYKREGIEHVFDPPPSNLPCVELFTQIKPPGIISLITSQVKAPGTSTDGEFLVRQLNQQLKGNPFFTICEPQRMKEVNDMKKSRWPTTFEKLHYIDCFQIKHYVRQPVIYTVRDFVSKSKDALHPHLSQLLHDAGKPYLQALFEDALAETSKLTVGEKFRNQLSCLAETLDRGDTLFVRCIKPNADCLPGIVDEAMVMDQLVSGGVVSALEMRKHGYSDRMDYNAFIEEFWIIELGWRSTNSSRTSRAQVDSLLKRFFGERSDQYACGTTRVFMRCGVLSTLRKTINLRRERFARIVQRKWRFKKGLQILNKVSRLQQALEMEISNAKTEGFDAVGPVMEAIACAERELSFITTDLQAARGRHSADTPRTRTPKIMHDMEKRLATIPRVQKLIENVAVVLKKIVDRKSRAFNLLSERLSGLNYDVSTMLARVEEVNNTYAALNCGSEVKTACLRARMRLELICREDVPQLQARGPFKLDLAQEYDQEDACPEASALLSEVRELVAEVDALAEALRLARSAFEKEVRSFVVRHTTAMTTLKSLQEDARNAAAESFDGVGNAFMAAWQQDSIIEGLMEEQNKDAFCEAVETFETLVAGASRAVKLAKKFMAQDDITVQNALLGLESRSMMEEGGTEFLQTLKMAEQELLEKGEGEGSSSPALAKVREAIAAVRVLGIKEQDNHRASVRRSMVPADSEMEGDWSLSNTHELGADPGEAVLSLGQVVPERCFTSVSRAVQGLNMGIITCEIGYCIVYSRKRGSYFVLYREDKKEMVLDRFLHSLRRGELFTCDWMFSDAGVSRSLARLNPLRWSGKVSFPKAISQLEDQLDKGDRPVDCILTVGGSVQEMQFESTRDAIKALRHILE